MGVLSLMLTEALETQRNALPKGDLRVVTFYDIVNDLLSYFEEYVQEAEKKYDIKKDKGGCWSLVDIKQVWRQTQIKGIELSERKFLALVALLQLIEKQIKDLSGLIKGGYIVQRSEDRDELGSEYKDGSGGNRTTSDQFWQIFGARQSRNGAEYLVFDQNTEDIPGVPRGHSWKPVEVERENKSRDKTLCIDEEDVETAGGAKQRKPERINSEGRSPQSKAELKKSESMSRDAELETSESMSRDAELETSESMSRDAELETSESMSRDAELETSESMSEDAEQETVGVAEQRSIYIRVPLAEMPHNEQTLNVDRAPPDTSSYKLIDGSPEADGDIDIRKSYFMSFNNRTNNAKWVYEILNKETLAINPTHPFNRGHLAAAGNHLWCQEAYNDANLNSNIAPQHKSLNRHHWNKLENDCRKLKDEPGIRNVHVYTGPLYLRHMNPPELLGKRVPSEFFKVIIVEKVDGTVEKLECYLLPNAKIKDTDIVYAKLPPTVIDFIQYIEQESRLQFIERRSNVREERKITVSLEGEDMNGTPCYADIKARISR